MWAWDGLRRGLVFAVLAGLAWQSAQQVRVWHSNLTLWSHAVLVTPENPRARINYAKALFGAGYVEMGRRETELATALDRRP